VQATDVGPIAAPASEAELSAVLEEQRKAAEQKLRGVIWTGKARVSMYTCVELGGCNRTASGIWPYEGVVAVDRRVIPLGSTVEIEGLGTFLAADTGGAIYGNRIDVFVHDYNRAIQWGVRYLDAVAYTSR
jgi:3D (Asp-Asp-Asp) domain-containing protein